MSETKTTLSLTGASTYVYRGTVYREGEMYSVADSLADHLLEQRTDSDAPYFSVVRERDAAGKSVKQVSGAEEAAPKAPAKKAAKKTVKVGGGSIEGLGDDNGAGDGDDGGEGVAV